MKNRFLEMAHIKKIFPKGKSVLIKTDLQVYNLCNEGETGIVAGYRYAEGQYWCPIAVSVYFPHEDKYKWYAYTLLTRI